MSKTIIAVLSIVSMVQAQGVTYDAEFWESFEDDKPYEHKWLEVPDLINKTNVGWWFNMTHHFLTGIERGMYMNDSITLNSTCFGPEFVEKANWFAAMIHHGVWTNWIQELALIYQFYYMWGEKCKIDMTFNDLYRFCWNQGCRLDEMWGNTENNILYMTRDMIDAAIVWYEGVPEEEAEDI